MGLSVTSARAVAHSVLHLHEVDRSGLPKRRVLAGNGDGEASHNANPSW